MVTPIHEILPPELASEIERSLEKSWEQEGREKKLATEKEQRKKSAPLMSQVESGRCSITPLPNLATQPFRSELAIEQSSIFVANSYKSDFFERSWEVQHPISGEPVKRKLRVGKIHENDRPRGVLTQAHQDVFYVLLDLWGKDGYKLAKDEDDDANGVLKLSGYALVKAIRGDDAAHHYKRLRGLLQDLTAIPIELENAYTWQGLIDRENFTLLGDVYWRERKKGDSESVEVKIMFSSRVTKGFLHQHVKMLLGSPYWNLRLPGARKKPSEIARLMYPFLDGQLAMKDEYRIRLDALFARFGLAPYPCRSARRRKILPAVQVLDGKPILGGEFVLHTTIRESSDGNDYVLVATRAAC